MVVVSHFISIEVLKSKKCKKSFLRNLWHRRNDTERLSGYNAQNELRRKIRVV